VRADVILENRVAGALLARRDDDQVERLVGAERRAGECRRDDERGGELAGAATRTRADTLATRRPP